MHRFFLISGAASAFLFVVFGAFGAHALKSVLSESSMTTFSTASQYHMVHSLALVALGILPSTNGGSKLLNTSGTAFLSGIILFSGSLYALALSGISILGFITPIGGILFLIGWACLALYAIKSSDF